jgi:hypothetical protein
MTTADGILALLDQFEPSKNTLMPPVLLHE